MYKQLIRSGHSMYGGYAGFTHTETICPPYEATFTDTPLNAVSWLWISVMEQHRLIRTRAMFSLFRDIIVYRCR